MKAILGNEINELINKNDFQAIGKIKADDESIIEIDQLPLLKTPKGVLTDSIKDLSGSLSGERIWAMHITKYPKCRLLMQCFRTKKSLVFNYEHQNLTYAVIIAEDLGLGMTGGDDGKTVLHCLLSGKTIKILDIGVSCFFRLGSVVAVADFEKEVKFFDLIKQKMLDIVPVKTVYDILCIQSCIRKSLKNNPHPQLSLFLGGFSKKIIEIILPEEITKKSITHINPLIG
jgi:hypothetical protein